ncbi:alpha/beta fold hydrolase [Tessaracoccus palaemonis]|uniref:Alpha/beta hydrolase n=1 Tax=Tessaracoccus palaemonis TaxID=2829499 RepID=A0ABX8SGY8_9ACTN|nr:alpha/beta fold hydrolase [Tessaracoccus palaemonis]QXT62662.1 alpha/beta hydrolase [Tessaracoccus palaemonis]
MTHTTRRMQDLIVDEHHFSAPLVWKDDADARTIDVYASVVSREGGENLPFLLYLQGGPGHEAPRPLRNPTAPGWLDAALKEHRVVFLDQRGTGRSTPVGDRDLASPTDVVVEHLTHLRADAIVRDAEALRERLGAEKWSVLGQSFGGFCTLTYLSTAAASLDKVYFTGGLSAIGKTPDEVYAVTYDKMRWANANYYRRFPEHRAAVERLVDLADRGELVLPDGEVVSVSRIRSLGSLLGGDNGWQTLQELLELEPGTNAFAHDLASALPFGGRNPVYYVLHESCYADGVATRWAADRAEPEDFRADPTLLTGEHVRREWADTVPAFRPWREVADQLAEVTWPRLYDADAIAASGAVGAAAIYFNDVYVPAELSLSTASLMPGLRPWVTNQFEHSGLRAADVLPRLIDLAHGRLVR